MDEKPPQYSNVPVRDRGKKRREGEGGEEGRWMGSERAWREYEREERGNERSSAILVLIIVSLCVTAPLTLQVGQPAYPYDSKVKGEMGREGGGGR